MPLYHYDIADVDHEIPGSEIELSSLAEAREMAVQTAGAMIGDAGPSFWGKTDWVMTVSDACHLTLFEVRVSTIDAPAIGRAY